MGLVKCEKNRISKFKLDKNIILFCSTKWKFGHQRKISGRIANFHHHLPKISLTISVRDNSVQDCRDLYENRAILKNLKQQDRCNDVEEAFWTKGKYTIEAFSTQKMKHIRVLWKNLSMPCILLYYNSCSQEKKTQKYSFLISLTFVFALMRDQCTCFYETER